MAREFLTLIDVRNFGTLANGEYDDGPAIQRAMNALADFSGYKGGAVGFAPGRYRILTPVTVPAGFNIGIVGTGSETVIIVGPDNQPGAFSGFIVPDGTNLFAVNLQFAGPAVAGGAVYCVEKQGATGDVYFENCSATNAVNCGVYMPTGCRFVLDDCAEVGNDYAPIINTNPLYYLGDGLWGGANSTWPRQIKGYVNPALGGGVAAPEGSFYQEFANGAGAAYVKTGAADTAWSQISTGGGGGVTLDGAYDFGGPGAGRAINVDAGAVTMTSASADNNNVLEVTKSPAGPQSGAGILVTMGAQASGAGLSVAVAGSGEALAVAGGGIALAAGGVTTYIDSADSGGAAVSAANHGRIRYNVGTQTWQVSQNGGAYANFLEDLQGAYDAGAAGLSQNITVSAARGSVVIKDANPTINSSLFSVTDATSANYWLDVDTAGTVGLDGTLVLDGGRMDVVNGFGNTAKGRIDLSGTTVRLSSLNGYQLVFISDTGEALFSSAAPSIASGAQAYIAMAQGSTAAVSAANTGRLRYNASTQKFQVSLNGAAYVDIATGAGGGTLDYAYDFGGAGAGRAIVVDAGAVTMTDNAADNNNVLEITKNPVGVQNGNGISITMGAKCNESAINIVLAAGTQAPFGVFASNGGTGDSFNTQLTSDGRAYVGTETVACTAPMMILARSHAGSTGDIVSLVKTTNATPTSGNCLTITMDSTASGDGINVSTTGSGKAIRATGDVLITGACNITGKLTVGGAIDPTSLSLLDAANAAFIDNGQGSSAAVSGASHGRLIYNATAQHWQVSENTGAYVSLATAAYSLQNAYDANGSGLGRTIAVASSLPVKLSRAQTTLTDATVVALDVRSDDFTVANKYSPIIALLGSVTGPNPLGYSMQARPVSASSCDYYFGQYRSGNPFFDTYRYRYDNNNDVWLYANGSSMTLAESAGSGGTFTAPVYVCNKATGGYQTTNNTAWLGTSRYTSNAGAFQFDIPNGITADSQHTLWLDSAHGKNLMGLTDKAHLILYAKQSDTVSAANTGEFRYNNTTHTMQVSLNTAAWEDLMSASTVTLNAAYNGSGSGAGRTITVTSNAVTMNGDGADNNNVLVVTKSPAGAQSGHAFTVTMGANSTGNGHDITQSGSGKAINISLGSNTGAQGVVVTSTVVSTTAQVSITNNTNGATGALLAMSRATTGTTSAGNGIDMTWGSAGTLTGNAVLITCASTNNGSICKILNNGGGSGSAIDVSCQSTSAAVIITKSSLNAANALTVTQQSGSTGVAVSCTATTGIGITVTQNTTSASGNGITATISPTSGTTTSKALLLTVGGGAGTVSGNALDITATKHSGVCLNIAKSPASALGGNGITLTMNGNCSGQGILVTYSGTGTAALIADCSAITASGTSAVPFAIIGASGTNYYKITTQKTTTSDGNAATGWTLTTTTDTGVKVRAWVLARRSGGNFACFDIAAAYDNNAGTVALIGAIQTITVAQTSGTGLTTACTFDINGTDIRLRVTGNALETWVWEAEIEYQQTG